MLAASSGHVCVHFDFTCWVRAVDPQREKKREREKERE